MTDISAPEQEPLPQNSNRYNEILSIQVILSFKIFSSSIDTPARQVDSNSSDIRSRYWTFLFDNLKRSIEQIYQTCESDQSPLQCKVSSILFYYRKKI